jgi:tRNA threonylcarbamoyladenosine biosynthesis protein TsaB
VAGPFILAIENSNPSSASGPGDGPGVALGRDVGGSLEVLGREPLAAASRNDDGLLPAIDRLFRNAGARPADLGRIAISIGPGGFTALRIAVAAAKMIAEATGAEVVAVPSADVAARLCSAQSIRFAVALASKAETAFITVFGPGGAAEGPGRVMTGPDFATVATKENNICCLVADQFLPPDFRALLEPAGVRVEPLRLNAQACLEASVGRPAVDPAALAPLYGREPEAVALWRARHGSPGNRAGGVPGRM